MASELARQKSAQAWCADLTSHTEMDVNLAEVFADILDKYIDALRWCSGSNDFAPKGKARRGWMKIQRELLS